MRKFLFAFVTLLLANVLMANIVNLTSTIQYFSPNKYQWCQWLFKSNGKISHVSFLMPTNDDCANAEVLTNGTSVAGSNIMATSQGGESVPGGITPFNSVWYSFTLTAPNQTVNITLTPSGAPAIVNPVIGIYSGPCFGTLEGTGTGPHCLDAGTYHIQISSLTSNEGNFDLTVSEGLSTVTASLAVTELNGSNDGNVCLNDGFTLTANPIGAAMYAWELNGTSFTNTTNTWSITNSALVNGGTYQVTVTDAGGCTDVASQIITINNLPTASNATLEECEDAAGSNSATFTLTDADASVNSSGGVTITYHSTLANAQNNTGALPTPYTSSDATIYARVTDNATGCFATSTITLTVHSLPTGVTIQNSNNGNSPSDFTVCEGAAINLNVAVIGSSPFQYNWTLPGGSTPTGTPLNIASADPTNHNGTWAVTVTDGNGCTASDQINITVTPSPSNDDCADAIPFATSGDNTCASQDLAVCGANGEASVWYDYTVPPNLKTLTISLSGLTNGVVNVYDGCGGPSIGATCGSSVTIDCPEEGAVYKVFVSSPSTNTGTFTLSATETMTTATNDDCGSAVNIADSPICAFFAVPNSTSAGACPENFSVAGCGLDYTSDAIVWYTFTPPAGTTSVQFQNIVGTLSVFDACPPTAVVAGGGCLSSASTVNVSAGTTYYVGIGVAGGSGPVGFEIKYNAGPANDDCEVANIDLGSGGNASSSNLCAGPDYSLNCSSSTYEASVWFTVTVDAGSSGIEFTVTGSGSTPVTGSGAGTLMQTGCGTTAVGEGCFTVGAATQILCIPPGTYNLQIATSTANSGDFNISVSQLTGGPSSPANDLCENASSHTLIVCEPVTISGNNTNACDELFSIGSCNFGTDPTTWHTITVDANATTIDITNLTGGAYLGIFESSPCGTNSPTQLAGAGCVTGNTLSVPVTGGSTYYIAVGHPTGTAYSFDIKETVPPPNDTPCTAETIGTATQNTTCCANQEVTSACAGSESSVWFVIPAAPGVITIDISFTNTSMTAPFVVEGFSGTDCNSLSLLSEEDMRPACNTGSFNVTLRCLDFETNNIYIRVGSDANTCGTFSLSAVSHTGSCMSAIDCGSAPSTSVPTNGQACLPGCNLSICGDGACDPDGNATYYVFNVDPTTASAVVIQVQDASFSPIISVANDCFSPFLACFSGSITNGLPIGSGTIIVRVEAAGGLNLDDSFTVCASAFDAGSFDCYDATLTVTRPEHPGEPENGPYCSGETVHFCYNVSFIVSPGGTVPPDGNNCQWIQGIVPVVYEGWDLVALPLSGQTPPGGAQWLSEGVVHYNFASTIYSPFFLPNGDLGLEYGPGGLAAGGDMPAGWYWASPGSGPDCTDGSNPDTAWGLPAGCGSTQNVNVCFDLKVKEFDDVTDCQMSRLKLTMFSFADGETGCWTNLSCAISTPLQWQGTAACNSLITITGDDKQTCSGTPVLVTATASDPGANIILTTTDNPNVTGETLSGTFPFGQMNLLETLTNITTTPQQVQYTVYGVIPGQVCQSPPITIIVTVYPDIEATISPNPAYVCNPGECIPITVNPQGGTGNYVNFVWTGQGVNGSGQTVQVCPVTPTVYNVTITDDHGCTGTASLEVDIKEPVTVTIDPTELAACKDGIVGNTAPIYATVNSGLAPYVLTWTNPPGIAGYGTPFFSPWDDSYLLLEESSQNTSGILLLTVTDSWGCTGTAEALITVDQGPIVTFTHLPVPCGSNLVDLVGTFNIGGSSAGLNRFELYACDDTFIGTMDQNTSTFEDIDMSVYGNCFKLLTYSGSGCIVEHTLTVTVVNGIPVSLGGNTQRCANGAPANIMVSNTTAYTSYIWSNGGSTSSISVNPTSTTTYIVTATQANGCTNVASHTINVNPAPIVSFSGSTSICTGQSTTLTGSSDIPGSTFTWTGVTGTTTGPTLTTSTAGSYTLEAVSPMGCKSQITVNVIVSNNLSPNINELAICDGSAGTLDAGAGFDTYLWNTGATTQTINVNNGGSYNVSVTKATCSGTDTVVVINHLTPTFSLPTTPITVCRTNDGFGPSSVNFTSQLNPTNIVGNWREITTSGVDLTTDLTNVSFLGVAAGTYKFEFTTTGATSPCLNTIDTMTVAVNACQCPQILPTGPLCNQGSTPVDMTTKKGNPSLGGTFSVINPVGIMMTNNVFNPTGLAAGSYTIEWELTPNCKPTVDVIVYESPSAALTTPHTTLCNDNATGSTTLDLNTILTSTSASGTWKMVSGTATAFTPPATVNATGLTKNDELIFRYITNTAQSPCKEDSVDLKIVVRDCKCPDVTITPLMLCNGNNTPIDLNSSSILTTTPSGTVGLWSSTLTGAVTQGRYFNALNQPTGLYTISFTLSNPIAGCTNKFDAPVTISLQPQAEVDHVGKACNINSGNGLTSVRLYDLLKAGYTTSGQWTQTSGSPTLSINAQGIVDFVSQPIGSVFKFTYTRTATAPCTPVSAEVTVTVVDCQCPPIRITPPQPLCNSNGILDLNTLEAANNSPGVWVVSFAQNGNIIPTIGDILDAKGLQEGSYRLKYSLVPAPSGGCQKDSTILLKIEKQNTAVTKDTTVCNMVSSIGPSSLDLRNLLVSTTGAGKWQDASGTDLTNFTNINYVGSPLGTINYLYAIPSVAPCVNAKIPAKVEVVDCSCEQIVLGQIPNICTAALTFDLKPYSDPKPGTWKSNNIQIKITNGILTLTNLPSGQYEIYYELTTPLPSPCVSDKKVIINVFNPKSAGTARGAEFCIGATDVIKLADRLDNEHSGGTWTVVSGGNNGFNATAGTFDLSGRSAGTYIFRYTQTGQSPCPDDQEDVTITINNIPVADAGLDKTLNCSNPSAELGTDASTTGINILYEWKLSNTVVSNLKKMTVLTGGIYTLTVRDTVTKCSAADDVTVILDADLPLFDVNVDTIECFGQTGSITLSNLRGGKSPYQISFDGGVTYGNISSLANLKSGTYKIMVKDANGCVNDQYPVINIIEPPLFAVNLGPDIIINLGEDTLLSIIGQYNPQKVQNITWKANGVDLPSNANLPTLIAKPTDDTDYTVTVINTSGCIATDMVKVSLKKVKPECIPNIIVPGSTSNGYFSVNCDEVSLVTKYNIYDRWGNLVFTGKDLSPSATTSFWNGNFKGQPVVPGVYVYHIELLYKDGSTESKAGDVTVLK
jgi:hypothetical protein